MISKNQQLLKLGDEYEENDNYISSDDNDYANDIMSSLFLSKDNLFPSNAKLAFSSYKYKSENDEVYDNNVISSPLSLKKFSSRLDLCDAYEADREDNFSIDNYENAILYFKRDVKKINKKLKKQLKKGNDRLKKVILSFEILADGFFNLGKLEESICYYQRCLNYLTEKSSYDRNRKKWLFEVLTKIGNVYFRLSTREKNHELVLKNLSSAIEFYQEAMPLVGSDFSNIFSLQLVKNFSRAQNQLADHYFLQGKESFAIMYYTEVIQTCKKCILFLDDSISSDESSSLESSHSSSLNFLLTCSISSDELSYSNEKQKKIQEILRIFILSSIKLSYMNLQQGWKDNVLSLLQDVIKLLEDMNNVTITYWNPINYGFIARILDNIGLLYLRMKMYKEAVLQLQKSLVMKKSSYNETYAEMGVTLLLLGDAYFGTGNDSKAHRCFSEAKEFLEIGTATNNYEDFSSALIKISILFYKNNDFDASISSLRECISLAQRCLSGKDLYYKIVTLEKKISNIFFHTMNYNEALKSCEFVLINQRTYLLKDNSDIESTLQRIATIYVIKDMNEKALTYYEESLKYNSSLKDRANVLNEMGTILCKVGRNNEAIECYQQSLSLINIIVYPELKNVVLNNLRNLYVEIGDLKKANKYNIDNRTTSFVASTAKLTETLNRAKLVKEQDSRRNNSCNRKIIRPQLGFDQVFDDNK